MKIKLAKEDAYYVCVALLSEVDFDLFKTQLEYEVTVCVLKDLVKRLQQRNYPEKNKKSAIKITEAEVLILKFVLPFITTSNDYTNAILRDLTNEVYLLWLQIKSI